MEYFTGKSVLKGIAVGKMKYCRERKKRVVQLNVSDVQLETGRFKEALGEAAKVLESLYEKALREAGKEDAMILKAHSMILEDGNYLDFIKNIICTQRVNAEYAVAAACDHFAGLFLEMEDESLKARAADVEDISW